MWTTFGRLFSLATAAGLGFVPGCVIAIVSPVLPVKPEDYPFLIERKEPPHHTPKYAGGISFRFAMAHDVIHERFAKHGPVYYRERNRITRERLAELSPDDPARFPLEDDLAAGLDRLGESDEAVAVMRDKLARQQKAGREGRDLYTSYANLGTFLIHGRYRQAMAGDEDAKERFREGTEFIRKSVEVNPEAHFGREQWQATIAEFIHTAMDDPELLRTFDFLGNRLDRSFADVTYGSETRQEYGRHSGDGESVRDYITQVGADRVYGREPLPVHQEPAPFDEPMLGIIGMWRQGGGANPHFALAIGETMLRVGQRFIAWTAYERASRMAERFSPEPKLQGFLRDHCRIRQFEIEENFRFSDTEVTADELRERFEAELAYGEGYQREYQQYEAAKIAAGVPITDEDFFADFHEGREPIASPSGPEEWYTWVPEGEARAFTRDRGLSWGVFGAGLAGLVAALLMRRRPSVPLGSRSGVA